MWVYDAKEISGYVIAAGAILGCCAGIFWSAQGAIMMAYPEEKNKGKYVAIFWALFNIGGILGSVITLGINLESGGTGGVSTATYTAFVIIMIVGIFLSLILAPPSMVKRSDGTAVTITKSAHWLDELKGVLNVWTEWRIVALVCIISILSLLSLYLSFVIDPSILCFQLLLQLPIPRKRCLFRCYYSCT